MKSKTADLLLLITAVLWGFGYIAVDSLLAQGMEPFILIAMRFFIASLILSIIFFKKIKYTKKEFMYTSLTGVALFLGFLFQTVAINYTTTTNVSFITAINVAFVPLIGYFLFKNKVEIKNIIAIIITLVGLWILTGGISNLHIGDILSVFGAFFFALHIVLISKFSKKVELIKFSIGQMYITSFLGFICAIIFKENVIIEIQNVNIILMLFLGLIPSALCFFLQNVGLKYTEPSKGSIILGTESLWGAIFAIFLLHEQATVYVIIGGILMMFAVLIDEIDKKVTSKKTK